MAMTSCEVPPQRAAGARQSVNASDPISGGYALVCMYNMTRPRFQC